MFGRDVPFWNSMSEIMAERPSPQVDVAATQRNDSRADRFMRSLLRLPLDGPRATAADAQRAFRTSIMVSALRCALMYVILPFVLPAIGIATDAATAIVLPVNVIAIVLITLSIRRFWRADHSKRWWYTALGTTVIAFLFSFTIADIISLF